MSDYIDTRLPICVANMRQTIWSLDASDLLFKVKNDLSGVMFEGVASLLLNK